ncbi:hypothetical protein BGZ68_004529, partial [Mortierella alpina]
MDVLPDTVQSSSDQDAPNHQQIQAVNKSTMDHYFKALTKTFKTDESARLMDVIRNSVFLRDTKTMNWFDSTAGGSGSAKA